MTVPAILQDKTTHGGWFALIVMAFPMVIDGVAQLVTKYESNNMRRFITGLLFGVGIMHAMILAIERVL